MFKDEPELERPPAGTLIRAYVQGRFGLSKVQMRDVAVLFLGWSLIENAVERAIWRLTAEPAPGQRPAMDGMPISQRMNELTAALRQRTPAHQQPVLECFAATAADVIGYRNTVAHGQLQGNMIGGISLNNHSRKGEARKRQMEVANLGLAHLALEAMETLYEAITAVAEMNEVEAGIEYLVNHPNWGSARSAAEKVRYVVPRMTSSQAQRYREEVAKAFGQETG